LSQAIRHVAVTRSSDDVFATAAYESEAQIWSCKEQTLLVARATKLSPGGSRLAVVGGASPVLVAAGWGRGLAAYDSKGNVIWNKSLPKIQKVRDLSWRNVRLVGVGLDASSYRVLQAETGDEIAIFRGVREIFASPREDAVLRVFDKRIEFSRLMERATWTHPLESFGVLAAAFGPDSVTYSEVGKHVICRDFTGSEMWRYAPRFGWHVLHLAWNTENKAWAALNWHYEENGGLELLEFPLDGKRRVVKEFKPRAPSYEFFPSGTKFVSADGAVCSSSDGAEIWRFRTD
jgi:hypothetical protein